MSIQEVSKATRLGKWLAVGVSQISPSKISDAQKGKFTECQDVFDFGARENCLWFSVADGLGSAPQSATGAKWAVAAIPQALGQVLSGADAGFGCDSMRQVFQLCHDAIARALSHDTERMRDFATTLQIGVMDLYGGTLTYGQVGDGWLIVSDEIHPSDNSLKIFPKDSGDPQGRVESITSTGFGNALHLWQQPLDKCKGLICLSDGMEKTLIRRVEGADGARERSPGAKHFRALFDLTKADYEQHFSLTHSLSELMGRSQMKEYANDDRTIVVFRHSGPDSGYRESAYPKFDYSEPTPDNAEAETVPVDPEPGRGGTQVPIIGQPDSEPEGRAHAEFFPRQPTVKQGWSMQNLRDWLALAFVAVVLVLQALTVGLLVGLGGALDDIGESLPRAKSVVPETAVPNGADPNGADPDGAVPNGADPNGADPNGADPNGADPDGADPNGAVPNGAVPNGAVPNGADPNGADPNGADPNGAVPNGADPNGAVPNDAVPNGADPNGADPNGADPRSPAEQ